MAASVADAEQVTAPLRAALATTTSAVQRWSAKQQSLLEQMEQSTETALRECDTAVEDVQRKMQLLQERKGEARVLREMHEAEVQEIKNQIGALAEHREELAPEIAGLKRSEAEERARVDSKQHEVDMRIAVQHKTEMDLSVGLFQFQELGLRFEKGSDDCLRMTFTNMDPAAPDREFTFRISLTADDTYEFMGSSPALASEVVLPLIDRLNSGNDFSRFVIAMRRVFKDTL